ncbi:hypothetical protein MVI27_09805 [Chryseobacterium salipaludis]|uniref:hypothetical protein n=1 Tax=Chryseobacterium TaxID=59732 RepID=UPI001FF63214|nr:MULTISPECIES: hypothetical protein [Chryseobacterium]MCJ8498555.1 hypothetical protein [Chryseobacterium salipaludis]MCX3297120.1 hypothetical protein [Planobacterium sp. JC490]
MDNPFTELSSKIDALQSKLDLLLQAKDQQPDQLLTKKEYLQKRQISHTTLWREEKRGLVVPVQVGGKRYYKFPN